MRNYDISFIEKIRNNQYTIKRNDVDILIKPIPDDSREAVMDPRVLDIAKKKMTMFKERKATGYRLSNERYRPDKKTVDLCTVKIVEEEKLIPIQNNHMIDIYLYKREDIQKNSPVMIYLHGGGMTAGDMNLYRNQMRYIAELSGAVVIFPEYRLSPECPYPGPIDDAFGTIKWAYENAKDLSINLDKFIVVGDSAGGALTSACVLLDETGIIKKVFEIYPGVDSTDYKKQTLFNWSYDEYPVIDEQKEYAYSRIERIKSMIGVSEKDSLYLQGKTTYDNPLVSIVYATESQLKKFPKTIIVSSEYDYLRIGSDYFVEQLAKAQVDVTSVRYAGCDHGFFDLLGTVVQAEELCIFIAEEVKSM